MSYIQKKYPEIDWIEAPEDLTHFHELKRLEQDIKDIFNHSKNPIIIIDMRNVVAIVSLAVGVLIRTLKLSPDRMILYGVKSELYQQFKKMNLHHIFKFAFLEHDMEYMIEEMLGMYND